MQKLIPIINKLQDVFNSVGIRQSRIDLPQIAVVGSQSCGKSSVLEAIVGHDFLPRGTDIVTRRPLVLQLTHHDGPMRAELLDQLLDSQKPPVQYMKRMTKYEEIRTTIAFVTDKACPDKAVIDDAIRLKIFSKEVIDLTLIDLPGITKNPVANQPRNIEQIIKKMIMKFIAKKNCIILGISAANVDLANSEAIKLSKIVDPAGDRTLGVLTKLDIMDKGTDAMNILTGKVLPLKKGFIGIVNRSQADIKAKKPIEAALRDERRFFLSHPKYRHIANRLGVAYLTQRLNTILLNHIRMVLPELREKIDNLLAHARQRLVKYGPPLSEGMGLKGHLLQLITQFSNEFVDCIEGRNVDDSTELFGGARINHIFFRKFGPSIEQMDPTKNLSDFDIKLRIQCSKGTRSSLYIPESAFETLVKIQVKRLQPACLRCCDQVFNELCTIIDHAVKPLFRFPHLKDRIRLFAIELMKQYMKPLKDHLRAMVMCELAYINTMHPDFFGGGTKVLLLMEKIRSGPAPGGPPQLPRPPGPEGGKLFSGTQRGGRGRGGAGTPDPLSGAKKKGDDDLYGYGYDKKKDPEGRGRTQAPPAPHAHAHAPAPPARRGGRVDREKMEVDVIRTLLGQYFDIVRKQITDGVPKAIMHFLVNMSCKNLHAELIRGLYTDSNPDDLLKENDDIKQKRKATKKMLNILLQAQEILNEVRDIELQ